MKSFRQVGEIVGCAGAPITSLRELSPQVMWPWMSSEQQTARLLFEKGCVTKLCVGYYLGVIEPRSPGGDNVYCALFLRVGGVDNAPMTKHLGGVGKNWSLPELVHYYYLVKVDELQTPLIFNYQIVSSSHSDPAFVQDQLAIGATALANDAALLAGDVWSKVLAAGPSATPWLDGVFPGPYDGPLAIDQFAVTLADLRALCCSDPTKHQYSGSRDYTGAPINGVASQYNVDLLIDRLFYNE